MKNLTLKQARDQGRLDEFAQEHEIERKGDPDAFNRTLASMAGKLKRSSKNIV